MRKIIRILLHGSSRSLHLFFSFGPCCRFVPSCSEYSAQALAAHGVWEGTLLTMHRLLRCHPFGASGYDPVPDSRK